MGPMLTASRRLPLAALLTLAAMGCDSSEKGTHVGWDVRFADEVLRSEWIHMDVSIVRGGCDATDAPVYAADVVNPLGDAGPPPPAPPKLKKGTYGFRATAWDAACRPYATGCTDVRIPKTSRSTVTVVLQAVSRPPRACDIYTCQAGYCPSGDGGADAGAGDPTDAGGDAD